MKTKSKIGGHIIRSVAYAVLLSLAFIAASSAFQSPNKSNKSATATGRYDSTAKSPSQPRALSFAERVVFQRAIEDIYWRHRIWPKENPDRKPALDTVMSQAQLQRKVKDYLRASLVLQDHRQKPITAEQLQAEMDRMARDTKQPEVLRELFEALGNDPAVIAECLVRPVLAERSIAYLSAQEQTRHVESPQADMVGTMSVGTTLGQVTYTLPEIANTGDPPCVHDTWTAMSTTTAPTARADQTAVWTGSEMIVWGGGSYYGLSTTGGRYSPSTDSWSATSNTNAPSPRAGHTAVWTGSEMIIWSGEGDDYPFPGSGGRYNPSTDRWTATSTTNAPEHRGSHTAVWTGSEMIVWSGGYFVVDMGHLVPVFSNTGGRYNPNTDSWTATSTTNAPSARAHHRAVWTGSEMIVWGGELYDNGYGFFNTGGRYNPSTDSWTATNTTNAPEARSHFTAVWTGSEMIVWGGYGQYNNLSDGGRYNPSTNSWTATRIANAPSARYDHSAVWTGSEMIIWGGGTYNGVLNSTGGGYNPSIDSWTATNLSNRPHARRNHTAIWTGSEMIVWGGYYTDFPGNVLNTGGRYCAPGLSAPVAHPATFIASNSFRANWSSVSGATYRLDIATNSSFTAYVTGYRDLNVGSATSYTVTGLNANTAYYYRVRAYDGVGTSDNSNTASVTTLTPTGAPLVVTNPATDVANSSATLNGSLDPHGLTTTVYFQYGTTINYGRTTPSQTQAGNTYRNISANISGLSANSVYHFRIVATNTAGTTYGADRLFTLVSDDFNNDNYPDYLLFNPATRGTVIWYMNNNVHVTGIHGPTLPAGWEVVAVADFNLEGHPDYLLFNPTTRGTVIWYMNNNLYIGGSAGPTLPAGWSVVAAADFNVDGYKDYLLFNAKTGGTVIWYLRNNVQIGAVAGPAVPAGWTLVGAADFNRDTHPDYLLFNANTGGTVIWYLRNNVQIGAVAGPAVPAGWTLVGAADFNRDTHPDYLLFSSTSSATVIWYMNNNVHVGGIHGPTIPAGWRVVAP